MDLTKGYWKVPLDADARLKSAFITPLGLYEFLTLPCSLKGASATFQHLVDQLLRGAKGFAVAYIDDICIFSQTWEDHVSQVKQVLDRLQEAGLTIKAEKCKVGMAEVSYLGHWVGSGCLKPEPAKVEAIRDWPTPQAKKHRRMLGVQGPDSPTLHDSLSTSVNEGKCLDPSKAAVSFPIPSLLISLAVWGVMEAGPL
ncbi:unnamed protein product [Lepidochelys kempii]